MMMKVQCDSCGTRYKLDESRIKGKGARITCPKCGHTFVVYRNPTDFDDEEPATIVADRAMLFSKGAASEAKLGVGSGTGGAKLTGDSGANPWDEGSATIVDMPAMTSTANGLSGRPASPPKATVPRPASVNALNWREVGVTAFKVKISIGLIYDFSEVALLKKYLGDKKVQRTDLLSFDGKEWTPINKLGDLDTFFIDKWVELKEAAIGEVAEENPAPSRAPAAASAFVPRPPKAPKGPPSLDNLFKPDGGLSDIGDAYSKNSPSKSGPSQSASPSAPMDGGLQGDMLFGGMPVPEGPTHTPSVVHRPSIPQADSRSKVRPTRPPPAPKASPMGKGQMAALVLLLGLAGLLGWFYQQGAAAKGAIDHTSALVSSDGANLKRSVEILYPTLYSPEGEGKGELQDGADDSMAPDVAPAPEEPQGEAEGGGADAAPGQAQASKAKAAKPGKSKKASPGVQVSSISAVDLVELGDAQLAGSDFNGAVASYGQAVALRPKNGSYLVKLGSAQLRAGDHKAAAQSLERGLKLAPGEIDGHKRLGEALEAIGRNQDARASYQRYLKARPNARDRADIEARIARLS